MTLRFQSLLGLMIHLRFLVNVVSNFSTGLSDDDEFYLDFLVNDLHTAAFVIIRNSSIEVKPMITLDKHKVLAILTIKLVNSSYHLSAIKV